MAYPAQRPTGTGIRTAPLEMMRAALLATALALGGAAVLTVAQPTQANAQEKKAARPEVGKPLQEAQALAKKGQHKQALAQIDKAKAVANKTPYETFLVDQTSAFIYLGMKQPEKAAEALEAALKTGNLSPEDKRDRLEAIAKLHYQAGNHDQVVAYADRAMKEGGDDGSLRVLMAQSLFMQNKHKEAAATMLPAVQAAEKAGKAPPEEQLQMLANAYFQSNDKKNFVGAMERLVRHYPKPEYWNGLLGDITAQPGFSDRLNFDVAKLRLATGTLEDARAYNEMAQQALMARFPNEAKQILDRGMQAGVLGKGENAQREQRLVDYANKQAEEGKAGLAEREKTAKTGDDLFNAGRAYASYGDHQNGIRLMEAGMKKGGLSNPEHARLRYGVALLEAGQKQKAEAALKAVKGTDGAAQLAGLWLLRSQTGAPATTAAAPAAPAATTATATAKPR
ncbi:MAG TPA: hypothetical protein VED40_15295 [Azospirillaceae bacterium]|nr:hypothetical protein [Azospirillaceae bacterium]